MSEQKTLIEQLAQKREVLDSAVAVGGNQPNKPVPPPIIEDVSVVETRSQVIQQVESIERAARVEQQALPRRRAPFLTSSVKWFATIAVVVVGVCCFVYLPNPQNSTPALPDRVEAGKVKAGKVKVAESDAQLAAEPRTEQAKASVVEPVQVQEMRTGTQAGLPEGTTITVTPVPSEISASVPKNENAAPVKPKAAMITPKIVAPSAIAKAPTITNQNSQFASVEAPSPSVPAVVAKPFELPAPIVSKTAQEPICSGTTGLAAEQCNQCSSKSWLSRVNCEAQTKANYCAARGRQTPDCTADYYTRG